MTSEQQMLESLSKIIDHLKEVETLVNGMEPMEPTANNIFLVGVKMIARSYIYTTKDIFDILEEDIKILMEEREET